VRCLALGDGVEDDGGEVGHKVRRLTAQRRQVPHRPTGRHTHANAATLPGRALRALIDRLLNLGGAAATAGLAGLLRLLGSLGFQLGWGMRRRFRWLFGGKSGFRFFFSFSKWHCPRQLAGSNNRRPRPVCERAGGRMPRGRGERDPQPCGQSHVLVS
jgi:hypothetical protein